MVIKSVFILFFLLFFPLSVSGKSAERIPASRLWELKNSDTTGITFSGDTLNSDLASGGSYYGTITVPSFDRAVTGWSGGENLSISLRVLDHSNEWSDWYTIPENGGNYLYHMGGFLSFDPFFNKAETLTLEIHAELPPGASLHEITLDLVKEEDNTKSTLVILAVMLLSGCVLYVKKRRTQTLDSL